MTSLARYATEAAASLPSIVTIDRRGVRFDSLPMVDGAVLVAVPNIRVSVRVRRYSLASSLPDSRVSKGEIPGLNGLSPVGHSGQPRIPLVTRRRSSVRSGRVDPVKQAERGDLALRSMRGSRGRDGPLRGPSCPSKPEVSGG